MKTPTQNEVSKKYSRICVYNLYIMRMLVKLQFNNIVCFSVFCVWCGVSVSFLNANKDDSHCILLRCFAWVFFYRIFSFVAFVCRSVAVIQCNKTVDCVVCFFSLSFRWFVRFAFLIPNKSTRTLHRGKLGLGHTESNESNWRKKRANKVICFWIFHKKIFCRKKFSLDFQTSGRFDFNGNVNDVCKMNGEIFLDFFLNRMFECMRKQYIFFGCI